jgi:hypothetical protein
VVDAIVPDGRICHSVGRKSHDRADDCASKDIVPVSTLAIMLEDKWKQTVPVYHTSCETRQSSGHRQ